MAKTIHVNKKDYVLQRAHTIGGAVCKQCAMFTDDACTLHDVPNSDACLTPDAVKNYMVWQEVPCESQ